MNKFALKIMVPFLQQTNDQCGRSCRGNKIQETAKAVSQSCYGSFQEGNQSCNDGSDTSFDSADADDFFGQEEDGFCCFTTAL
jgi:hypothetical protein